MASIIKKKKKGQTYYYLVESARVDGKPRIVRQKYLGRAEHIAAALETPSEGETPKYSIVLEFGAVMALFDLAKRLGVVELINQVSPKRAQGRADARQRQDQGLLLHGLRQAGIYLGDVGVEEGHLFQRELQTQACRIQARGHPERRPRGLVKPLGLGAADVAPTGGFQQGGQGVQVGGNQRRRRGLLPHTGPGARSKRVPPQAGPFGKDPVQHVDLSFQGAQGAGPLHPQPGQIRQRGQRFRGGGGGGARVPADAQDFG